MEMTLVRSQLSLPIVNMTGYSDTPLIVTLLVILEGVTVSEDVYRAIALLLCCATLTIRILTAVSSPYGAARFNGVSTSIFTCGMQVYMRHFLT